MLKRSVIGLVVTGLALTYAPAYADPPETTGLICQFASVEDPTAEPGTQSGQISGGPVLLTEQGTDIVPPLSVPGAPETGTLTCRVQVNQSTHAGGGPSVSAAGTGVFFIAPTLINYTANDDDQVFLCSEFTDQSDGITYYWDDDLGEWVDDITTPCSLANGGTGDPSDDIINRLPCPTFAQLPSPLAELLQDTWEDCVQSAPQNVILVHNVPGTSEILIVTPPLWGCTNPTGFYSSTTTSVTCSTPGLNNLTGCKEVLNATATLPGLSGATVSGTTSCGGETFSVSTTTTDTDLPPVTLATDIVLGGASSLPVTCSWSTSAPAPLGWGVVCGWNLPFPLGLV